MDYWAPSVRIDDEFEKLMIRMHPPRVTVDNDSIPNVTLIKVDSANKRGSLLGVVQVLNDLNMIIRGAYISSDGEWFMDVFHVTDQYGNKLSENNVGELIQESLEARADIVQSMKSSVGVQSASKPLHLPIKMARTRPVGDGAGRSTTGTDQIAIPSCWVRMSFGVCGTLHATATTANSRPFYLTDSIGGPGI